MDLARPVRFGLPYAQVKTAIDRESFQSPDFNQLDTSMIEGCCILERWSGSVPRAVHDTGDIATSGAS